jgi:hypothetical protein
MAKRTHRLICESAARDFQFVLNTYSENVDRAQDELEAVTAEALRACYVRLVAALRRERSAKESDPKPSRTAIGNRRPACRCKSQFCGAARPK